MTPTRYDQQAMCLCRAIRGSAALIAPTAMLAAALCMAGCRSGGGASPAVAPRNLSAQDFASPTNLPPARPVVTPAPASASSSDFDAPGTSVLILGQDDAAQPWAAQHAPIPALAPITSLGASSPTDTPPAQTGAVPSSNGALIVDQMVGEINGKPLYASDFLAPLDAQLRAEAARLPAREWVQSTARTVHTALIDHVRDELLLAEFYAGLKPEQRAGVLAYIQRLRTQIVSQNLGAEALANERLLEREGLTIEEKVKQESERQLVLEQLRREVLSRVVVSYRDIERYYDKHFDDFNPPPAIKLRVIRVSAEDESAVVDALAGEPFADVAVRFTRYNADEAGVLIVPERSDGSVSRFFGPEPLNDPAAALQLGQTIGPIGYGGDKWWINYESLERRSLTLYEAQDRIEEQLRQERYQQEQDRFFVELLDRARISDLETMVQRIVEFAAVRYLPNGGQ